MASACVSARRTVCKNMILRPYGVVKRWGPATLYKYWAQERGPCFGRDQIDNFSSILAEIRSTTSPVFWPTVTLSYSVSETGLWPAGYKPCFAGSQTRCVRICAFLGFWQRD